MENRSKCDICKIDVHRAFYVKHLRYEKHLENIRQDHIFIPEWLFKEEQTPIRRKTKKVYNPKTSKQIARDIIILDDKELEMK